MQVVGQPGAGEVEGGRGGQVLLEKWVVMGIVGWEALGGY